MELQEKGNSIKDGQIDDATGGAKVVEEANSPRKEIKKVKEEYDVEWDEKKDESSEIVHEA